ncbi:MAG: putative DNA binding domain-containing protein [Candidatus Saganbacteria bacterium]|nr:putative DNA binding domain-containing protein [Candidatus Saganbacteria bacterium]
MWYLIITMTWQDIIDLLGQGEGQSLEFEKQIPSPEDIARDMVAFANADGGKIVYGIDDKNGHLLGVSVGDDYKNVIKTIAEDRCHPKVTFDVELNVHSGKKIVIITVQEGDEKPYKSDDIAFIRDAAASRPAKEEEEKQITNPWSGYGLNKRQLRAMQMITEHGKIVNREYREAFNISHKTAHIELTMLSDKKLVLTQGSGRSTCYVFPSQE